MLQTLLITTCLIYSCGVVPTAEKPSAADILETCNLSGGLIVNIGCDGRLTAALHANCRYLVHGLDPNVKEVAETRKYLDSLGIYGCVCVMHWDSVLFYRPFDVA